MDFKKAFTYMFLDKELPKVAFIWIIFYLATQLIGSIDDLMKMDPVKDAVKTLIYNNPVFAMAIMILLIFLIVFAILAGVLQAGFGALLIKNSALSPVKVLPGWGRNFKSIFSLGFRVTIGLILLILTVIASFAILPGIAFTLNQPFFLVISIIEILLCIPVILFFIVMANAIFINFIHKNSLWAMFDLKGIFKIVKADVSNYFLLLLANFGIALGGAIIIFISALVLFLSVAIIYAIISIFLPIQAVIAITSILGIACLFLLGFFAFYFTIVNANLIGQYYKEYLDTLEIKQETL